MRPSNVATQRLRHAAWPGIMWWFIGGGLAFGWVWLEGALSPTGIPGMTGFVVGTVVLAIVLVSVRRNWASKVLIAWTVASILFLVMDVGGLVLSLPVSLALFEYLPAFYQKVLVEVYKPGQVMCPFCLERGTIYRETKGNIISYACNVCPGDVPAIYATDRTARRVVISAVGFVGHGKTAYFASLFWALKTLKNIWPGFNTLALDPDSLQSIMKNVKNLDKGELPDATPVEFPRPTIVRFMSMPGLSRAFFLFYDTSGESYTNVNRLITHARFVVGSRVVMFFLNLDLLAEESQQMEELLQTYIQGLSKLKNGNSRDQHLIVVLSKADEMQERLASYPEIWGYLQDGRLGELRDINLGDYLREMARISRSLEGFFTSELGESGFVSLARREFRSVEFTIVSSLGAKPIGRRLSEKVTPKRILDPVFWMLNK